MAKRLGPYKAEYVPGHELRWHVVRTQPNRENTAAAHLAGRGIGVYIPELGIRRQEGRRVIARAERMFPGYVILLVSGIEFHRRRIEACPGVLGILRHASTKAAEIAHDDICGFMALEARSLASDVPCGRSRRSWRRRTNKGTPPDNPDVPEGVVRMRCKSYWDRLRELDTDERNLLFRNALGV